MTELGWILSSEFLEELRELCLGVEPVLIGHLLNALFRIAQGKLDLLQQILVDNHLGRLSCNAFRDLCQVAGTDIQHIGIEMHIAIGGMVKGKLTQEFVVQLTAPALEVTDVGHLTVHVAVGLQDGFLKTGRVMTWHRGTRYSAMAFTTSSLMSCSPRTVVTTGS